MPPRPAAEIRDLTLDALRESPEASCLVVSGLLPLVGLTDIEAAPVFFPFDTPAYQQAMGQAAATGKTSLCGITTEVGWRNAGVQDPLLYGPYFDRVNKGQYTVMRQKQFAEQVGAWVNALPWIEGTPLPGVGDAPVIGCTSCGEGYARGVKNLEHEYTIISYDPDLGPGIHHSIAGGQPGVAFRTRGLVQVWTGQLPDGRRTGELWAAGLDANGQVVVAADGRPAVGRRFLGYSAVNQLPRGEPQGTCIAPASTAAALVERSKKPLIVGGLVALAYLIGRALRK